MSAHLDPGLQSQLRDGETVLWQGRPMPLRYALRLENLMFMPLGLLLLFVGVFILQGGVSFLVGSEKLLGLVFLFIGSFQLLSPWFAFRRASRIRYVVTTQRCLVFLGQTLGDALKPADLNALEAKPKGALAAISLCARTHPPTKNWWGSHQRL